MKRVILTLLLLIVATSVCFAQGKDRRKSFKSWENYEITTLKVGVEGTKYVKVWGFGKSVDKAIMSAKRNAVHACLFRGLPASNSAMATPALLSDPEAYAKNQAYFDEFFQPGGAYLGYINVTTDGVPGGQDRRKVKGGFKVAISVQVMFDNLRDKMENDGLIRKLSTGF
jgi:hypothetical protein